MTISIITAIAANGVIGKEGGLPWSYPTDMKYFRDTTRGKTIIMGRRTFELDAKKPLPNRRNIIVTSNPNYTTPYSVDIVDSLEKAIAISSQDEEIFIIGGSRLYKEGMDIVDKLYITLINRDHEGDTYFPKFDWSNFVVTSKKTIEENNTKLDFIEAIRI